MTVASLGRFRTRLRLQSLPNLAPPIDIEGPRVRLGLVWWIVTTAAVVAGTASTSIAFAAVALAAAGQVCQSWKGRRDRAPFRPVAIAGAAICSLAAMAGPVAVLASCLVVVVAAGIASVLRLGRQPSDARLTIAIALLVGLGAGAPALIRGELGAVPALVFLTLVHVVDASAFIVGSGASNNWEGRAAGVASAAAVGLAVAALLVPPFRGLSPVVLAGSVGLLAPAGPLVATTILGRAEAPVPALRRLDSLLVVGPIWALAARLVLDLG